MLATAALADCMAAEAALLALATRADTLERAAAALLEMLAASKEAEDCAAACAEATALSEATSSAWFSCASTETDACAAASALLSEAMVEVADAPPWIVITVRLRSWMAVVSGHSSVFVTVAMTVTAGAGDGAVTAALIRPPGAGADTSSSSGDGIAFCSSWTSRAAMCLTPAWLQNQKTALR